MSRAYWACEGIGFEQDDLIPFLHGPTLLEATEEKCPELLPLGEAEEKHQFSTLSNKEQVELMLNKYIDELDERLPDLLILYDEKQVLSATDNGDGKYFLLYPPRFSWDNNGGFKSSDELVEYIRSIVQPFCRGDVTEEQVRAIIDNAVFEVGCG